MMTLIKTTGLIERAIIAQTFCFCVNKNQEVKPFCREIAEYRADRHANRARQVFLALFRATNLPSLQRSNIECPLRRAHAAADTVRNPDSAIGIPCQIQPRVFLNQGRNPHDAILMPHVVLRHR
jgi:hypothetical protein